MTKDWMSKDPFTVTKNYLIDWYSVYDIKPMCSKCKKDIVLGDKIVWMKNEHGEKVLAHVSHKKEESHV